MGAELCEGEQTQPVSKWDLFSFLFNWHVNGKDVALQRNKRQDTVATSVEKLAIYANNTEQINVNEANTKGCDRWLN